MSTVIASSIAALPAATAAAAYSVDGMGVGWGRLPPSKVVAMAEGGVLGTPSEGGGVASSIWRPDLRNI